MRLLCIKGHDVINLQIKSIKWFISENLSCKKKIMPEKREDSYQTTSIARKESDCKNKKCRRIHLNVHVQKNPKNSLPTISTASS